ncbi:MAG TPA: type I-D CRISPR-associated helicase Cas3' [Ktedonobacteraceae bacterium]|nr:type I-D CRISPR-associated helicase Cas3' [Ktedonobacteraceae bacterium]
MKSLHILPVYSAYHPEACIGPVRLLKHQVATLEAFHDQAADVIFNTAMTGDGKSLAAYLPALRDKEVRLLAMYPTNELIQDQHTALAGYQHSLKLVLPRYDSMYGSRISQLMREHDEDRRFEEARKFLVRNNLLLTNPDLVHLMLSHQSGWEHQGKELAVTAGSFFDYFLFDEFHVFGVPQAIAVMNMLGYLLANYRKKAQERKKFVFLSATPNRLLTDLFERGGIHYTVIEGDYASSERPDYRRILQPCQLFFHESSQDASLETWVQEHLDEIVSFFNEHSGSKAAILVYSVATARRLVTFLHESLRPYGLEVGENTGLASAEERRASFHKHILVGTTTVDIGIDFRINYLIFEASNAGSFLQRFGRLGRHDDFTSYQAHAFLPRFVLERLEQKFTAEQEVERPQFNEAIREAFPSEQEFRHYTRRWGVVQAAQVLAKLKSQEKRDANTAFGQALQEQYESFYGSGDHPAMAKALKKYYAFSRAGNAPEIIEELSSFRGQSPLSCGIWDTDNTFKIYDLFFLLANTNFEVMDKEVFLQAVRERGLDEREFRHKTFYLRIWEYMPKPQALLLGLRHNLREQSHLFNQALVLDDFFVREPRSPWLDQVNRRLKPLHLPCLLSSTPGRELKGRYNLPGIFPLYRLKDGWGQEYTVAFGQEALLLDSLLFFQKPKDGYAMML